MEPIVATALPFAVKGLVWTLRFVLQTLLCAAAYVYQEYYLEVFWLTTAVVLSILRFCCFSFHPGEATRLTDALIFAILCTPLLYIVGFEIRQRSQERKEKERKLQQEKEEAEERERLRKQRYEEFQQGEEIRAQQQAQHWERIRREQRAWGYNPWGHNMPGFGQPQWSWED